MPRKSSNGGSRQVSNEHGIGLFDGVHAPGRGEFSLCGTAFDAFNSGDVRDPVVFASVGEKVTCKACLLEIEHVRKCFNGSRFVGSS